MPRFKLRYPQRENQAAAGFSNLARLPQLRPASGYAAARFAEWEQNAPERDALLQARLQKAQADAELAGVKTQYDLWKENELRRQTMAYYTAMPMLQDQLKENGIYPGSQRYAAEMAAFAAELPDAITHNQAIREDLHNYSKVDEDAARIQQMMSEQGITKQQALLQQRFSEQRAAGMEPQSTDITAEGGVNVRATAGGANLEDDLFKAHKITKTQFSSIPPNAMQIGNVNEAGTFSPDLKGSMIQFPAGMTDQGTPKMVRMSVPEFNQYKLGFQGQQTPAPTPEPATQTNQPVIRRYNPETGELE